MIDGGKWSKSNEKFILDIRDYTVEIALQRGYSVIVDDTNLDSKHEERLQELADLMNAEFVIMHFDDVPLRDCIKRNQHRTPRVEDKVIYDMYNRYLKPKGNIVEQDPNLPEAIMFDLDGTLALFGDNNPYDREFIYDELNYPVYDALRMYQAQGKKIIICSGRNGKFFETTDAWLGKHGIKPDLFLMRKENDSRKDVLVKQEMFLNHILPNYYVNAVYDDRDQVVELWRDIGLTCFQVAEGKF